MQTTKKLAYKIIMAAAYHKIDKVVISPGSRNAPLTISFSTNPYFDALSIVDERCAAFFGLGIAQQTKKPVILVCTSGSALLNYYPAIAEAYYSNIPLIIISADRPKHLIDIGDGQTIRQKDVFHNHIEKSVNLKEEDDDNNTKLICETILTAINSSKPVHINVPFDEPLYDIIPSPHLDSTIFKNYRIENNKYKEVDFDNLSNIWNSSKKKLIIIGVHKPCTELQETLDQLISEDDSVIVMTETTSNLKNTNFISAIDQFITNMSDSTKKLFKPELIISIGGFIVSKRIKQLLRSYKSQHWHIDPHTCLDTYFSLTEHIKLSGARFFKKLKRNKINSNYKSNFIQYRNNIKNKHIDYCKNIPYSDFKVTREILKYIPDKSILQISNSSLIRYTQLFDIKQNIDVYCNRGTSGIDGSTSTAIGASYVSTKQTTLLTGDISFFYDSNGLWNDYIPNNFRIIIINNNGGGIFKILPGPSKTDALTYFETKHNLTAKHLSRMYNFEYNIATNEDELKTSLTDFFTTSKKPKILEVFTPSQINHKILKEYFEYIK